MSKLQENNNAGALSHIRVVELGDIPASYATRLLADLGADVADSRIGNRVALATSLAEGLGITEAAPSSRAAEEIVAAAEEIMRRAR